MATMSPPPRAVDCADVRMVRSRCRTRFAAGAYQCLLFARHIFGKKLQSNEAPKLGVLGLVHNAHAAAEFLDNSVVSDGLADPQKMLGFRLASSYRCGIR
jgi:hypothetical protein